MHTIPSIVMKNPFVTNIVNTISGACFTSGEGKRKERLRYIGSLLHLRGGEEKGKTEIYWEPASPQGRGRERKDGDNLRKCIEY